MNLEQKVDLLADIATDKELPSSIRYEAKLKLVDLYLRTDDKAMQKRILHLGHFSRLYVWEITHPKVALTCYGTLVIVSTSALGLGIYYALNQFKH